MSTELDNLDKACTVKMGWKVDRLGGWKHTKSWRMSCLSPTRNDADRTTLESWLLKNHWGIHLEPKSGKVEASVFRTRDKLCYVGLHKDPATALCIAVVKMHEGTKA